MPFLPQPSIPQLFFKKQPSSLHCHPKDKRHRTDETTGRKTWKTLLDINVIMQIIQCLDISPQFITEY
ncbi:hypothetical protein AOLI_G00292260 [Acnodon oligacanthus]